MVGKCPLFIFLVFLYMPNLKEIGYSILSQCYNFNLSDDIDVDLDWVYYQVSNVRNAILAKKSQSFNFSSEIYKYYNRLNCVPVECVDIAECCTLTTDCNILRVTLPTNLLYPNHFIVEQAHRKRRFEYLEPYLIPSAMHRRIKISLGYWYYIQNKIYIITDLPHISVVSLTGVFEYPERLFMLENCEQKPCYIAEEEEYPIEAEHLQIVEQYVVGLIRASLNNVKDLTNNALDDAINVIRGDMESLNQQLNSIGTNKQNA